MYFVEWTTSVAFSAKTATAEKSVQVAQNTNIYQELSIVVPYVKGAFGGLGVVSHVWFWMVGCEMLVCCVCVCCFLALIVLWFFCVCVFGTVANVLKRLFFKHVWIVWGVMFFCWGLEGLQRNDQQMAKSYKLIYWPKYKLISGPSMNHAQNPDINL